MKQNERSHNLEYLQKGDMVKERVTLPFISVRFEIENEWDVRQNWGHELSHFYRVDLPITLLDLVDNALLSDISSMSSQNWSVIL